MVGRDFLFDWPLGREHPEEEGSARDQFAMLCALVAESHEFERANTFKECFGESNTLINLV